MQPSVCSTCLYIYCWVCSLSSFFSQWCSLNLWFCLSFFLRRCHILQPPHPPHRAGRVPAAAHHRTASLVLPQVNSPTLWRSHPLRLTPSLGFACWLCARLRGQSSAWQTLPSLVTEAEPSKEVLLAHSLSCLVRREQASLAVTEHLKW